MAMIGNFFKVDLDVVRAIAVKTKSLHLVLVYLVLCKFQQNGQPLTTIGANGISEALKLPERVVAKHLNSLRCLSWGDGELDKVLMPTREWNQKTGETLSLKFGRFISQTLPCPGEAVVYVPNILIDGVGKGKGNPPLLKLLNTRQAELELATMLLILELYSLTYIDDCSGVDPDLLYRKWETDGTVDEVELGFVGEFNGTNFWIAKPEGEGWSYDVSIVERSAFGNEELFQQALNRVFELNFAHEVAVVFDVSDEYGHALYPLRVYDKDMRKKAEGNDSGLGGLSGECLDSLCRVWCDADAIRVSCFKGVSNKGRSDFFVYAAQTREIVVKTVLRLKYLPLNRSTQTGIEKEVERVKFWQGHLRSLSREKNK